MERSLFEQLKRLVSLQFFAGLVFLVSCAQVGVNGELVSGDSASLGALTISSPLNGSIANDTTPTISGSGLEADATVIVTVTGGGGGSCTTSTDLGGGTWSCTLASALTGGASVALSISAVQADPLGNNSTADTISITLDTTTPSAPVIVSPADGASTSSGAFTVSGTSEVGASIAVSVTSETATCTDTADGSGNWSCTLDETLADATYTVNVTQTDTAGNGPSTADSHSVTVASSATWTHQAYLKALNNSDGDSFGVSVSIDSDTAIVGANAEDSTTTAIVNGTDLSSSNNSGSANGAAYVFKRTGSSWAHEAYLKAPNNSNSDNFGWSVSLNGDTAIVGAYLEASSTTAIVNGTDLSSSNNSGSANGAAYVFKRTGTNWAHEAYLKAPNNSDGDNFGVSVSIDSDTAIVGAYAEASSTTAIVNGTDLSTSNNSGSWNGAAYVFKRTGTSWAHEAYLKAPNNSDGDTFGFSVSLSGDTAIVGAYQEDSSTTAIVNGTDLSSSNNSGSDNGSAYVFKRTGASWAHEAYLKSPNNSNNDFFGYSVSLSGDTAIIGAHQEASSTTAIVNGTDLSSSNNSGSFNGAAYVFKRTGTSWAHEAYLKAPNNSDGDTFGISVSIDSDTAIVAAYGEASSTTAIVNGTDLSSSNNSGSTNGAAYVFKRTGSTWVHEAYLKAPLTTSDDQFGISVGLSSDTAIVGAYFEDSTTTAIINGTDLSSTNDSGSSNGAAYIFTRN